MKVFLEATSMSSFSVLWHNTVEYSELFIPIIFMFLTHFLDTKIHQKFAGTLPYRTRIVNRLFKIQWELNLLIVSILFLEGFKVWHKADVMHDAATAIIIVSFILILLLMGYAIYQIANKNAQPALLPLYAAVVTYCAYLYLDLLLVKDAISGMEVLVLVIIALVALAVMLSIWYYVKEKLFDPRISNVSVHWNKRVYNHRDTPPVKKMEALRMILFILSKQKQKNRRKIEYWISRGKTDFKSYTEKFIKELDLQLV